MQISKCFYEKRSSHRMCSLKNWSLKLWQDLQKINCVGVSFQVVSYSVLRNLQEWPFLQNTSGGCFRCLPKTIFNRVIIKSRDLIRKIGYITKMWISKMVDKKLQYPIPNWVLFSKLFLPVSMWTKTLNVLTL